MYPLKSYVLPPVGVRLMDQGSCTVSTQLKAVHTQVVTTHTTKVMRPQMSFLHLETMQSSLKCFIGSENFKASQFLLSSPLSVSDPGHFLPNSATSSLSEGKKSSGRAVRWQNHCVSGFEKKSSLCVRIWRKSFQVRDLLLWQDVYVWEGLGGAGGVSSSQVGLQKFKPHEMGIWPALTLFSFVICLTLLREAAKAAKVEKESLLMRLTSCRWTDYQD